MKSNIKKCIKPAIFCCFFILLFLFIQAILMEKWIAEDRFTTSSWDEFKTMEDQSLDVFFVGTSQMYSGVDPLYLYDQSGIRSYVLAGSAADFDILYVTLQEAFKKHSPKALIMDMSAAHFKGHIAEAKAHFLLDQISFFSKAKWKFAFEQKIKNLKALDVLIPFFRYHDRWSNLNETDFRYVLGDTDVPRNRGHYVSYVQHRTKKYVYFDETINEPFTIRSFHIDYMNRIADLCKENNCDLIMIKIPNPDWQKPVSDAVAAYAEEMELPYFEYTEKLDEIGIIKNEDYRDNSDHLNQYGAEKMTAYLQKYLEEHYDFEDHRGKDALWDEDLKAYKEYLVQCAQAQEELNEAEE